MRELEEELKDAKLEVRRQRQAREETEMRVHDLKHEEAEAEQRRQSTAAEVERQTQAQGYVSCLSIFRSLCPFT